MYSESNTCPGSAVASRAKVVTVKDINSCVFIDCACDVKHKVHYLNCRCLPLCLFCLIHFVLLSTAWSLFLTRYTSTDLDLRLIFYYPWEHKTNRFCLMLTEQPCLRAFVFTYMCCFLHNIYLNFGCSFQTHFTEHLLVATSQRR